MPIRSNRKEFRIFLCFCGCQLYYLEGDGRLLRLAGNWLELNLAEDSWELANLLDEGLTSQGTLLKGARHHGWVGDTGELNRLLLDGKWLGKAGLDHLLGDAHLGGLLLNNVGHTNWPVQILGSKRSDVMTSRTPRCPCCLIAASIATWY